VREASIRVVGHVFHEKLIPSSSSWRVGSNGGAAVMGGGWAMIDGWNCGSQSPVVVTWMKENPFQF
jgi:hypothetical protein